jgi:hypothetical protein
MRPTPTLASLLSLSLAGLVVTGCSAETATFRIDHHKASCQGLAPRMCLLTDDGPLAEGISGFEYRWGYETVVEVEVETIDDPPLDGSSIRYDLREVLEERRVGVDETFRVSIFDRQLITAGAVTDHAVAGERDLDCATSGLCAELETALGRDAPCVDLALHHPATDGAPLVLDALAPTDGWGCPAPGGV